MEHYLKKYAALLTHYCLSAKKNDTILIQTTTAAEPLLPYLYEEILSVGAHVETLIEFKHQKFSFYNNANTNQLEKTPLLLQHAIENFDSILTIDAPHVSRECRNIPDTKKTARQLALDPIRQKKSKRAGKGNLKWSLCIYPTSALAKEAKMTLKEFIQFWANSCFLTSKDPIQKWVELGKRQDKIVSYLNKHTEFHFTNNQIDLSFSTNGRKWINSDGKRNMPSGEVFISPVESSVNGHVYFSFPTRYMDQIIKNVALTFKNGTVTDAYASHGQNTLDTILALDGANRVGEIAIGNNPNIQSITYNTLFDEKIDGTIHLALGNSYIESGGKNKSSIHWDIISNMKNNGKIYASNKLIYQNGNFLL